MEVLAAGHEPAATRSEPALALASVSDNFASLTFYLYLPDDSGQSLLHKMTGSRGSFQMEATGGDYARFNFTFQGSFVAPIDVTTPSGRSSAFSTGPCSMWTSTKPW